MTNPAAKHTVLLVDDERNLVRVLEARLRREGYGTVSAFDGAEALTVLRRYTVDAVVLDVQMAGLSGDETLKAIHAIRPGLPVVIMSAYGKPEGMADHVIYLEKPFNLDMLVSSVANALQSPRATPVEGSAFTLFSPGQPVRLVAPDGDGLCYGSGYIQAETVDLLEVDAPVKDGRPVIPPAGAAVRVTVTGRDALYSFNTRVQAAPTAPGCLAISKPDIIERHQRRSAPRHAAAWPLSLEVLPPGGRSRPVRLSSTWRTVNVSDTGMMVLGEATVPANSAVVFTVDVPGHPPISGRARVVWDAAAPKHRFQMGLEFTDIPADALARLRS
ncbi:MAG TPA: response regulator [Armatimonadota bacterium]|jgi:CheY-like chemotaxis protein/c-di-GMP-binding flagellar brake protein YcgR